MPRSETRVKRSSQGQLVIWDGMKLSTMFRFLGIRPSLHWSRAPQIATLPLFCTYNSVMAGIEKLLYGRRIRETQVTHPPIFILGHWRSGTTLLHNLLTQDTRFTYPTLYQTLFPWHFLTTQRAAKKLTGWMVPKSRPMDNMPVSWDVPQEDDVAICVMSLISPYTLVARPFDLDYWTRSWEIENLPPRDRQLWEETVQLFLKKLTLHNDRPIILKSPGHTFRIRALLKLYPDAKFLYISRNPYNIFRSTIHLRHMMVQENTLGKAVHPSIENNVIDVYMRSFHSYERDRHLIPAGHLHEIRYEDFVQDPLGGLEAIYQNLDLGDFEVMRPRFEQELPALKSYQRNRFPPSSHWQQEVYNRCREAYDRFGYPPPHLPSTAAPVAAEAY